MYCEYRILRKTHKRNIILWSSVIEIVVFAVLGCVIMGFLLGISFFFFVNFYIRRVLIRLSTTSALYDYINIIYYSVHYLPIIKNSYLHLKRFLNSPVIRSGTRRSSNGFSRTIMIFLVQRPSYTDQMKFYRMTSNQMNKI